MSPFYIHCVSISPEQRWKAKPRNVFWGFFCVLFYCTAGSALQFNVTLHFAEAKRTLPLLEMVMQMLTMQMRIMQTQKKRDN
ncbi:hypothetical protein FKM82_028061 [Ascaphus truei]